MLCLGRKKNEVIHVYGPCTITIVDIRGDTVRIGIDADDETKIIRDELLDDDRSSRPKTDRTESD